MNDARIKLDALLLRLEEQIRGGLVLAKKFEEAAAAAGYGQPALECGAYLVGHLESFAESEEQPGSVPSLRNALDEWEDESV